MTSCCALTARGCRSQGICDRSKRPGSEHMQGFRFNRSRALSDRGEYSCGRALSAAAAPVPMPTTHDHLVLALAIDPAYRGRGIERSLLVATAHWAAEDGYTGVGRYWEMTAPPRMGPMPTAGIACANSKKCYQIFVISVNIKRPGGDAMHLPGLFWRNWVPVCAEPSRRARLCGIYALQEQLPQQVEGVAVGIAAGGTGKIFDVLQAGAVALDLLGVHLHLHRTEFLQGGAERRDRRCADRF